MSEVLRLVHLRVSVETVDTLLYLLNEAKAGRIIGLAAVCLMQEQKYAIEITGDCKHVPVLCRGMVNGIDDELFKLIRADQ